MNKTIRIIPADNMVMIDDDTILLDNLVNRLPGVHAYHSVGGVVSVEWVNDYYSGAAPDVAAIIAEAEAVIAANAPNEITLEQLKAAALSDIDARAEAARKTLITPGEGQMGTYLEKAKEAEQFLAAQTPQAESDYPLLAAVIGADGDTLHEVATRIARETIIWRKFAAAIDGVRRHAKVAVGKALTAEEVGQAQTGAVYPSVDEVLADD